MVMSGLQSVFNFVMDFLISSIVQLIAAIGSSLSPISLELREATIPKPSFTGFRRGWRKSLPIVGPRFRGFFIARICPEPRCLAMIATVFGESRIRG